MKRVEWDSIVVRGLHEGESGLGRAVPDTVEGARENIDERNRALVRAGDSPKTYLICCSETYQWFADNGEFLKEEKFCNVIERYPEWPTAEPGRQIPGTKKEGESR